MEVLRILGLDPGARNYAYGIVYFKKVGSVYKYSIKDVGLITNTVTEMKENLKGQLRKHISELRNTVKYNKVDRLYAERFMTRGNGGNLSLSFGVSNV